MSIFKGVVSYTRFLANTKNHQLSFADMAEKLNLFKFRPLHERGEDNQTIGWCPYMAAYDHEKSIEISDFKYDDKIILTMRLDVLVLPKELLKSLVKKNLNSYQQDHNKLPDKTVKKEIEMAEAKALRMRILPKTKVIESLWDQKSHELRVFCRSQNLLEQFLELFMQTFLIRPEKRDFPIEAKYFAKKHQINMETLSHQPIFLPTARIDVQ
jgi:DNA recombination-dependent growth factor C